MFSLRHWQTTRPVSISNIGFLRTWVRRPKKRAEFSIRKADGPASLRPIKPRRDHFDHSLHYSWNTAAVWSVRAIASALADSADPTAFTSLRRCAALAIRRAVIVAR